MDVGPLRRHRDFRRLSIGQLASFFGSMVTDVAVAFQAGTVKQVYYVADTKGSLSSRQLREVERSKIECARKFFAELNAKADDGVVKYDVVTDYASLRALVGSP